ncbi:MAG: pyruvate, phosphate dikinase, partial [Bdellovibrionales bacterium]|nr:pyruvate, phosphate dikinase [Bdellovibrionales bacterium]
VTIRLLDPPLHEFLPQRDMEIKELAEKTNENEETIRERVETLKETNPMLGHRGCRLAISFPEIYQMQVRAIAEAVCERMNQGESPVPEIMIPLVMLESELKFIKELVEQEIKAVQEEKQKTFQYLIGTMIELPRAALVADELANHADFFSFGTNDLTQTTLGISRDDCGKFLPSYVSENLISEDPFATIDQKGVGFLIRRGVQLGRGIKPNIKIGICGEHGAEEKSIDFFNELGLNYISCSAYRVPVARLIAARSHIEQTKQKSIPNKKQS